MERSSGILMPISSLPSPYGIGTFGKAAYDFVDFLDRAGQRWWQILPVGPTSLGDSPYMCPSAYAGNPFFIDLDMLAEDGLLRQEEIDACSWGSDASMVDYKRLHEQRIPLLRKAAERGMERDREALDAFAAENADWLPDYTLYTALKDHFDGKDWMEWPEEAIRMHRPEAVAQYTEILSGEVRFYSWLQFLFFSQWKKLRAYAKEKGIGIIGDMPIYVAMDSADVWASPESFLLDEKNVPKAVSGCPPDYFSEDGQLWGNPLYNFEYMKQTGYGWWIRRIGGAEKLYDVLRIDHFRGFESFWAVPYGEKTAKNGHWEKGPGMDLIGMLKNWFSGMQFIAEDLGAFSPELIRFLEDSGFPGMRVLEFAFSPNEESSYLPHNHIRNCVCYAGTHDNDTIMGWKEHAQASEIAKAIDYLGLSDREGFAWGIIRGGMSSVADLFIAQMQDYLELGSEARMNTPGEMHGNWQWRMLPNKATPALARRIAAVTELYGRKRRT